MSKISSYRHLFQNRDYTYLFIGQVISFSGDALTRIALPLYVYQNTGNLNILGGAFALQYLPWVLFGPIAGVIADRGNRKFLLVGAVWVEALSLVGVVVSLSAWQLLLWIFIGSLAQTLKIYVQQAAMPDVVGFDLYSRAVSLNVIVVQATDTVGVAIAGGIVTLIGAKNAILIDVLTFFVNSAFIMMASVPQPRSVTSSGRVMILPDIVEGLRFLRQNAPLQRIFLMLSLRGLTMIGVFPLFVAFIERVLQKGAFEFGLFTAAASLGYVLSSILTVRFEKLFEPFSMLSVSTALSGIILVPFLWVRTFEVLLILRFCSALLYGAGNLVVNVQIAQLCPSDLRGRISSITWAFVKLSQAISSSSLSALATLFGIPLVISVSGLSLFLSAGLMRVIWAKNGTLQERCKI